MPNTAKPNNGKKPPKVNYATGKAPKPGRPRLKSKGPNSTGPNAQFLKGRLPKRRGIKF